MKKATIYSYSKIYISSEQFKDQAPYISAILETIDGTRFIAFLKEEEEGSMPQIGSEAEYLLDSKDNIPIYQY